MNIKGVLVLLAVLNVGVAGSYFVNYSGLPPYVSFPLTVVSALAIGVAIGRYLE